MNDDIIICPHCKQYIMIEKLNCGIFRHASYIHSGEQIHPHMKKEDCIELIRQGLIYGCGKPFQLWVNNYGILQIKICDYI